MTLVFGKIRAAQLGATPSRFYVYQTSGGTRRTWFAGNSLTFGTNNLNLNQYGFRKLRHNTVTTQGYLIEEVGTLSDGDWTNPLHDGHPGYTIQNFAIVVNAEYGTANIPVAAFTNLMIGINNCFTGVYDGPNDINAYIAMVQKIQTVNHAQQAANQQGYILVTTVSDKSDLTQHGYVVDLNTRFIPAWDYIDANRPSGAPLLLRANIYDALGGRFSAPNYDVSSGNTHWTQTGFAAAEQEFWRVIQAGGIVQPP